VPELALTFKMESIELPDDFRELMKELDAAKSNDPDLQRSLDERLEALCQQIFFVPAPNVISFSGWRDTAQVILKTVHSLSSAKASDAKLQELAALTRKDPQAGEWLKRTERLTASSLDNFGSLSSFVSAFVRNGVLRPAPWRTTGADILGLSRFADQPDTLDRLYEHFREEDLTELDLGSWQDLTQTLKAPSLGSVRIAETILTPYEFPIARSPRLELLTLEQFKKVCYGAAALMIGSAAYTAVAGLQQINANVLVTVVKATATSLMFVSTAELSQHLEHFLNGRAAKARRRKRSTTETRKVA